MLQNEGAKVGGVVVNGTSSDKEGQTVAWTAVEHVHAELDNLVSVGLIMEQRKSWHEERLTCGLILVITTEHRSRTAHMIARKKWLLGCR